MSEPWPPPNSASPSGALRSWPKRSGTRHLAGPVSPFALFRHLQDWLGLPEEACGGEINTTLFLMVRSGLYTSNTHDVETGTITLAGEPRLTASRVLTLCLHGDVEDEHEI